jgi:hypothetical protein
MISIVIAVLGLLAFGSLTIYYTVQRELRAFATSVAVLTCACVSALIMSLAAPHKPLGAAVWRLANVSLLIIGGIMYQREWNRRRRCGKNQHRP